MKQMEIGLFDINEHVQNVNSLPQIIVKVSKTCFHTHCHKLCSWLQFVLKRHYFLLKLPSNKSMRSLLLKYLCSAVMQQEKLSTSITQQFCFPCCEHLCINLIFKVFLLRNEKKKEKLEARLTHQHREASRIVCIVSWNLNLSSTFSDSN